MSKSNRVSVYKRGENHFPLKEGYKLQESLPMYKPGAQPKKQGRPNVSDLTDFGLERVRKQYVGDLDAVEPVKESDTESFIKAMRKRAGQIKRIEQAIAEVDEEIANRAKQSGKADK